MIDEETGDDVDGYDEDEETENPSEYTVVISLDGPDGEAKSRRMAVDKAIEWLGKKTGYKSVQVTVQADVEGIRAAILDGLTASLDRKAAEIRKELSATGGEFLTQAEAQAVSRVERLLQRVKAFEEEIPWMLALAQDIRHDRDDHEAERKKKERYEAVVAGLKMEMAVPGRKCSNHPCSNLFSVHGIAMNIHYRGLVCGVCGKGGEGEKIIVFPDPPPAPALPGPVEKKPAGKKRRKA